MDNIGQDFRLYDTNQQNEQNKMSLKDQIAQQVVKSPLASIRSYAQALTINLIKAVQSAVSGFFPSHTFETMQRIVNMPDPEAFKAFAAGVKFQPNKEETSLKLESGGQCHGATFSALKLYNDSIVTPKIAVMKLGLLKKKMRHISSMQIKEYKNC